MKSNKILILTSTILILFLIEVFCSFFLFKKSEYNYKNRYLVYSEGNVFRNIDNFFTYEPNTSITASNYYFINDKFKRIYNYIIKTNNLGLVQDKDLIKESPSILFLGDSFTEGQGDGSWLNYFDGEFKNHQIINGGLLGTGFQQFELMNGYLSDYDIQKVFVLYIGDDLRRDVFQFNDQQLKCLRNHTFCQGSEIFFSFPTKNKNIDFFLKKLRDNQRNTIEPQKTNLKTFRRNIKSWLTNLYVIKIPLDFLRSNFYNSKNEKIIRNFNSINNLINKYQDNIYFINLKMKGEIIMRKKSYESLYAKDYILRKTNNYFECDFNNDLDLFYNYDSHPNKKGYKYLYNCVFNILENQITLN